MRKIIKTVGEKITGDDGREFGFCVVGDGESYVWATYDDLNPNGTISHGSPGRETVDEAEADALMEIADLAGYEGDPLPVIRNAVAISYKAFGPHPDGADDNAHGYAAREKLHRTDLGGDGDIGLDWVNCEEGEFADALPGWTMVHCDGETYTVRDEDMHAEVQWVDGHRGWYTAYPLGGQTSCGDPEAITDGGTLLIKHAW